MKCEKKSKKKPQPKKPNANLIDPPSPHSRDFHPIAEVCKVFVGAFFFVRLLGRICAGVVNEGLGEGGEKKGKDSTREEKRSKRERRIDTDECEGKNAKPDQNKIKWR